MRHNEKSHCLRNDKFRCSTLSDHENSICLSHVLRAGSSYPNGKSRAAILPHLLGFDRGGCDVTHFVFGDRHIKILHVAKITQLKMNKGGSPKREGVIVASVLPPKHERGWFDGLARNSLERISATGGSFDLQLERLVCSWCNAGGVMDIVEFLQGDVTNPGSFSGYQL